jgi:hypothetical protein
MDASPYTKRFIAGAAVFAPVGNPPGEGDPCAATQRLAALVAGGFAGMRTFGQW